MSVSTRQCSSVPISVVHLGMGKSFQIPFSTGDRTITRWVGHTTDCHSRTRYQVKVTKLLCPFRVPPTKLAKEMLKMCTNRMVLLGWNRTLESLVTEAQNHQNKRACVGLQCFIYGIFGNKFCFMDSLQTFNLAHWLKICLVGLSGQRTLSFASVSSSEHLCQNWSISTKCISPRNKQEWNKANK